MRITQNTTDRLVLEGGSPLFRPFFAGGLGFLILGMGLLVGGPFLARSTGGSGLGPGDAVPAAGLGVFLATFGFFVAIVPAIGKIPYRREMIVDRAAGHFVRRDRTLLRLRQETFTLGEIRGVEVEAARHVDGDPYFTLVLRLESGETSTLDRFTDHQSADRTARLIRDHLAPVVSEDPSPRDLGNH